MTLKTLGDLDMIHDYSHTHNLRRDKPEVIYRGQGEPHDLSLDTRGIFPSDDNWAGVSGNTEYHREGGRDIGDVFATTYKIWGLTRDGEWLAIEVYATRAYEPYKYEGRTELVERVKTIWVEEVPFPMVCQFSKRTPQEIWTRLGEVVKKWAEHREHLFDQANGLAKTVQVEESLVKLLQERR